MPDLFGDDPDERVSLFGAAAPAKAPQTAALPDVAPETTGKLTA